LRTFYEASFDDGTTIAYDVCRRTPELATAEPQRTGITAKQDRRRASSQGAKLNIQQGVDIMAAKSAKKSATKPAKKNVNLPEVSKQTAGGIGGAAIGGMIAGPVGAIVGGVVGAMVGNASAEGKKPIKKAVDRVREELPSTDSMKKMAAAAMPASLKSGKKQKATAAPKTQTKVAAKKAADVKPAKKKTAKRVSK
jgi:hypothetical protein